MDPYLKDVLDVCLRLLHVTAGIAWIGASFYFVRLDLSLRPSSSRGTVDPRIAGEFWGVHGGGLYLSQKYRLAPPELIGPLHWFKWEAYTTWLSGFALMVVLYYADPELRLVDPAIADLANWEAIALSLGGLVLAWVVYDVLCRTVGKRSQVALGVVGVATFALTAWGASELFAPRAAYIQVGAMLGTIMAANVLLVIIPAHRKLVTAMEERQEPDQAPLLEAKARSVHNNYLTLPVLFTMLAGHASFVVGHERAWVALVVVAVLTASVRHFFNLWHTGRRVWWIPAGVAVGVVALAVWLQPEETTLSPLPGPVAFAQVQQVITGRCSSCHSGVSAPLGITLVTADEIEARADDIERVVLSRLMPPGNVTGMTEAERSLIAAWVAESR